MAWAESATKDEVVAKCEAAAKMIQEKVVPGKQYPIDEALDLLRELSGVKFKESVDVSINLGVDPRKSDQVVRGSTVLPNGTGKSVRVAVFTQGANADAAKEAGADIIGMEDLAEQSVDELTEMAGIDEERAAKLIMKAREHWFAEEQQA